MKAETLYLDSLQAIKKAVTRIMDILPEQQLKIVISGVGTKSSRQRGLQWMWYEDIANSGKGGKHCDTKEGVHLVCKYRFAVPIFIRDDDFFSDLWEGWRRRCDTMENKEERMLYFVDQHVSTEKMSVSQTAEYLTDIQRDCINKQIELREPQFRGLLEG
jgi:hypothetical protein